VKSERENYHIFINITIVYRLYSFNKSKVGILLPEFNEEVQHIG